MPEHRKILSNLLLVAQREAVPTITPGVTAQLNPLRVQQVDETVEQASRLMTVFQLE